MSASCPSPSAAPSGPHPAGWRVARSPRSRLVLLLVLLAVLGGVLLAWHPSRLLTERLPSPWAEPVFVAVFALGTLAFVPKPLLNVAAGVLFGFPEGLALAVAGTTLGAALAFGLGRGLGRDALRSVLRGRVWRAVDRGLTERGFRAVLMLRLFPGMPFPVANYGAAVSGVRLRTFLGATALGVVPATAAYVAAGKAATSPDTATLALSVAAFVVVGVLSAVPLLRARRSVT